MSEAKSVRVFDDLFLDGKSDRTPPSIKGNLYLLNGEVLEWKGKVNPVYSPICHQGQAGPTKIGEVPDQGVPEAEAALEAAVQAFHGGLGEWPQSSTQKRIAAVEKFVEGLVEKRAEIVNLLMWEICKNEDDAKKEVDRTIQYIKDTIIELQTMESTVSKFETSGGILAQTRRVPLGVTLCLGPFNYPLNETYTTLIPALLMGNTVVMKTPKFGCLSHMPTLELFAKCFPKGVVNIISGPGRVTMPAIMRTGKVDVLAFIGTSQAASEIVKAHPRPFRLRLVLGLDAKNIGVVLPSANLDVAVEESVLGGLSFNGQRCTALKLLLVHESLVDEFVRRLSTAVDKLKMGLPWVQGVKITPLPEAHKPKYLQQVIQDALSKGAKVMNERGNHFDRTLVSPTVLYPVTENMTIFHEEQFGPILPVAVYRQPDEVIHFLLKTDFGQQASVFGTDPSEVTPVVNALAQHVSRININTQCQRGPDTFPFTGRKNSAAGTLSVYDALRSFSIRATVATKAQPAAEELVRAIARDPASTFLQL